MIRTRPRDERGRRRISVACPRITGPGAADGSGDHEHSDSYNGQREDQHERPASRGPAVRPGRLADPPDHRQAFRWQVPGPGPDFGVLN